MCAVLAVLAVCGLAASALADTAPVPSGSPWTDPAHDTPLEQLASQIASHIAGTPVTVHCESDGNWAAVVSQAGGDPGGESGFVATTWNGSSGEMLSLSNVAELSSSICVPLEQFASAQVKPTKCLAAAVGKSAGTRRAARKASLRAAPIPVPCYLGGGRTAAPMTSSYWSNYALEAVAILTLAHESIHLGGIVGGTLSNGLAVGDPQAEAKADCFGMQWMPYVAEQLGDTPDDAQAIARYFWDKVYPLSLPAHPQYWSADCRPGGALDLRPPGTAVWP